MSDLFMSRPMNLLPHIGPLWAPGSCCSPATHVSHGRGRLDRLNVASCQTATRFLSSCWQDITSMGIAQLKLESLWL